MSDLAKTYIVMGPNLTATAVDVAPTIWQDLGRSFGDFRGHLLVAKFDFDADWPSWEMHPAGDEIVVLLSGRADIILEQAGGHQIKSLAQAGSFVIVPKGSWHTGRIAVPTSLMFVTPGEGTEHRPK